MHVHFIEKFKLLLDPILEKHRICHWLLAQTVRLEYKKLMFPTRYEKHYLSD